MTTLWLVVFVVSSQLVLIIPILPRISEEFRVSEALLGLLGTAYAVTMMVFALIAGPVSDRIGRRKIICLGSGAMAVALFLHWPAGTFAGLLGARALAGVAAGILAGAAVSYIGDYYPYDSRGRAMGWIMSSIAIGQVLGIPAGTVLAASFSFHFPFVVFGGVMIVAWLIAWLRLPQPPGSLDAHPLRLGRVLRTYLDLLQKRATSGCIVLYVLVFAGIGLFLTYLPVWLEASVGLSATQVATVFLIGGLVNVVASPLCGRLSDRFGRKPLIIVAHACLVPLTLAFPFVVDNLVVACSFIGGAMVFMAMRLPAMQALMTSVARPDRRGSLFSLANAAGQAGFGVASAFSGIAYASTYGFTANAVGSSLVLVAAAVVVWRMLPEPRPA